MLAHAAACPLLCRAGEPLEAKLCSKLLEGASQMEAAEAAEVLADALTGEQAPRRLAPPRGPPVAASRARAQAC